MKKLNNSGCILAETLVVTVFLMVIFTMLYTYYNQLIGEYQKRETYDDVDGKYVEFWMKKLIEDGSYIPQPEKELLLETVGFMRFECEDVTEDGEARNLCRKMVRAFEIAGCDSRGNNCEIFITHYRIGGVTPDFKDTVKTNIKRYQEKFAEAASPTASDALKQQKKDEFIAACRDTSNTMICAANDTECRAACSETAEKNVFPSRVQEYIVNLPDFAASSLNYAKFRVIVGVKHTKDNNNYYSYSTIEVDR